MELVAQRYNAISLDQLVAAHHGEEELPPRAVLLTFDDGYADFEHNAWPILHDLGLPSVLFVPTSFPDTPGPGFWWDRLHAALRHTRATRLDTQGVAPLPLEGPQQRRAAHKVLRTRAKMLPHGEAMAWLDTVIDLLGGGSLPSLHRVLGWDALRKLAGNGVAVCSHGHLHALVTRLDDAELASDLATSKSRIESELGPSAPPPVFAYPAAFVDSRASEAVRDAGYVLAFGGRRGIDRLPFAHPLGLARIPVHGYPTALFRAQLRPSVDAVGSALIERRERRNLQ
jgi:peptidoglycan/xylan/chitin deacetylase (PgdA/CDA1 family)